MEIYYGIDDTNNINVTNICMDKLRDDNYIIIPHNDVARSLIFSDPYYGKVKNVIVKHNSFVTTYNEKAKIIINVLTNDIKVVNMNNWMISEHSKMLDIQSKMILHYGEYNIEIPEQLLAIRYLTGNEKVLELGSNIGRNSLNISSILNDSKNLVTLECDLKTASLLRDNRDANNFKFGIEAAALSKRKLISQFWNSRPYDEDEIPEGWTKVETITFDEIEKKYNIQFDTLVVDCEGAFYYILQDMPEVLNNIKLIIIENDFSNISHKKWVDEQLIKNNFNSIHKEYGIEAIRWFPNGWLTFYQVWKK